MGQQCFYEEYIETKVDYHLIHTILPCFVAHETDYDPPFREPRTEA